MPSRGGCDSPVKNSGGGGRGKGGYSGKPNSIANHSGHLKKKMTTGALYGDRGFLFPVCFAARVRPNDVGPPHTTRAAIFQNPRGGGRVRTQGRGPAAPRGCQAAQLCDRHGTELYSKCDETGVDSQPNATEAPSVITTSTCLMPCGSEALITVHFPAPPLGPAQAVVPDQRCEKICGSPCSLRSVLHREGVGVWGAG